MCRFCRTFLLFTKRSTMRVLLFLFAALTAAVAAQAQTPPPATQAPPPAVQAPATPAQAPATGPTQMVCGQPVPFPRTLPPDGSGPVVYQVVPCFQKQGGFPVVEANTYLYYIQLRPSVGGRWVPYDETTEQVIREDFKRLWATNFLDDLAIRVEDYTFSNGVVGKLIVYDMEERQRVKIVDYEGLGKVDQSEDRRSAQREEHQHPPRLVHRSGPHPARDRRRPRALCGRGLSVRRGQAGDQGSRGRHEARARDLPRDGGAEGQDQRRRLCRESGDYRRQAEQEDEGEQRKRLLWLHHRRRHLQGRQVRRGRAAHHRLLPRRGVHPGPGGPAADEDPRRLGRRQDPVDSADGADHRGQEVRGRRLQVRGQQGRQLGGAPPAVQDPGGGDLQSEEGQEGPREGAGGLRFGRVLRVHRLSGPAAARPAEERRRGRRGRPAVARSALAGRGRHRAPTVARPPRTARRSST